MRRDYANISERMFFGELLCCFQPPIRLSSMDWGVEYRTLTSKESTVAIGKFDPNVMPYMEYVYDCLDNNYIPFIVAKKPARIGWTEVINTYIGKRIHTCPTNILVGFATLGQARKFAAGKWKEFMKNTTVLKSLVNIGLPKNKENMFHTFFPNGDLLFATLGSIINQKGDNIPVVIIEEPDDVKDDVSGQGDSFKNVMERMKLVPKTLKKCIFGGTPSDAEFSRVEKAIKQSNWMIFKAKCHGCGDLVPMDSSSFENLKWDEYENRHIDPIYGKDNPNTARFECPFCKAEWSFAQKTLNILEGKKYGFTDHTGNFSKGWHAKNPSVTETFGFDFCETMGCFEDGNNYVDIVKDIILARIEFAKGNEAPMKSLTNNRIGNAYSAGFTSLEAEEMVRLRSNYKEGVVPYEGLVPFMGIDVQHNRFAIVQLAAARNGNVYLVKWFEIFGNVFNWEDSVWTRLTDIVLDGIPHAAGKTLPIEAVSIDCQDGKTSELVYRWVVQMNNVHKKCVMATRGCRELRYSSDDIYQEPSNLFVMTEKAYAKTKAESMGVLVYPLGTHRCQDEILRRINLNKNKDESGRVVSKYDVFYFNEQSYGGFEEQMTSCKKLVDITGNSVKEIYRLIPGKHMDAMAATKNAFHAMYARRIREFTSVHWDRIEEGVCK